jgi:hypothetical protein
LGEIPQNTQRNKIVVYEMWKVLYRLYWTFHIFEGIVFKLIPISFIYVFFLNSLFAIVRRKKNIFGLYLGEGSENRPFEIFDAFPWATGLRLRSQIGKGLFSDPSLI